MHESILLYKFLFMCFQFLKSWRAAHLTSALKLVGPCSIDLLLRNIYLSQQKPFWKKYRYLWHAGYVISISSYITREQTYLMDQIVLSSDNYILFPFSEKTLSAIETLWRSASNELAWRQARRTSPFFISELSKIKYHAAHTSVSYRTARCCWD